MKVAIVGLGRAGARYPATAFGDGEPVIRNHLDAVLSVGGGITALVDPDPTMREAALKKTDDKPICLPKLADLGVEYADIITICTPSAEREDLITQAIAKRPRLIIVEKPLAMSSEKAAAIARRAQEAGVTLRVCFNRRFDSGLERFRSVLPGTPRKAVFRYGKGLFNYASHAVDLAMHWFGEIEGVQAVGSISNSDDPTVSFQCRMKCGFEAIFLGLDGLKYDQFEADFFFSDCRAELANGGAEKKIYEPVDGLYYESYAHLRAPKNLEPPAPIGGLVELYKNAAEHLSQNIPLAGCNARHAVIGLAVLEAALQSAELGGKEFRPSDFSYIAND